MRALIGHETAYSMYGVSAEQLESSDESDFQIVGAVSIKYWLRRIGKVPFVLHAQSR